MRVTLADAALSRYAGRFVWLELNFDKEQNQAFLNRHGVAWTPAFYVLDPADERATAAHMGGMTLQELTRFLEEGERGLGKHPRSAGEAALVRGDQLMGQGLQAEAVSAYREALRLTKSRSPERIRVIGALTSALEVAGRSKECAETVVREAAGLARDRTFASVVGSGLSCANTEETASWARSARKRLEPLAVEASALPTALRDDRFQLYQSLMGAAQLRNDSADLAKWGDRWLQEIDAATPASDDERTALDVARVDAVRLLDQPARAIPALVASERAMPDSDTAPARLAAMQAQAKRYDDALATCERGLSRATGPIVRTGLLLTKAKALRGKGDSAAAHRVLEDALQSARAIGPNSVREHHVRMVSQMIAEAGEPSTER